MNPPKRLQDRDPADAQLCQERVRNVLATGVGFTLPVAQEVHATGTTCAILLWVRNRILLAGFLVGFGLLLASHDFNSAFLRRSVNDFPRGVNVDVLDFGRVVHAARRGCEATSCSGLQAEALSLKEMAGVAQGNGLP